MIPYMSLEEQVDSDFIRARRRAFLRRVGARFHKDPTHNRLLSFDEVREASLADNRTYLGTKIVEAEKIVGSVGRRRRKIHAATAYIVARTLTIFRLESPRRRQE
jgi:hypothetical protein